jgi:hypothetical protein
MTMTTATPLPGQTIWCLGMYASASTWMFNVARRILQTVAPGAVRTVFVGDGGGKPTLAAAGMATVVKSHDLSDEAQVVDLAQRSSKILITVRDPRDAVASQMRSLKQDFARALDFSERSARLCARFSRDRRAMLFRYETGFFEDAETVAAIARHLGHELTGDAVRSIFGSLTRAEVEKYISKMPSTPGMLVDVASGDLLDPNTHWHSHHAGRNGQIGKWKKFLTLEQAAEVERRLGFYFEIFQRN